MQCFGARLIIILCVCMHMNTFGINIIIFHITRQQISVNFFMSQALAYLLYPLLGWMADVCFTRYKFVLCSFILMIIGSVLMLVWSGFLFASQFNHPVYHIYGGFSFVACLASMGMFESTAIQFGMDQMKEASSEKLSAYVHWYYWSSKLGRLLLGALFSGMTLYYSMCHMSLTDASLKNETIVYMYMRMYEQQIEFLGFASMIVLQFICALLAVYLLIRYKRKLSNNHKGHNPWKLVCKVLKYAWNHTCPERRSAFTYWEEDIPPRIDLGKSKYGGPFTTEEVEDTKTFLRILLLIASLFGFQLSGDGYSVFKELIQFQCPQHWLMIVADPMTLSVVVMLLYIPVYQYVVLPQWHKYLPNLLKRIGLGMLCCATKQIIEILLKIRFGETDHDCNVIQGYIKDYSSCLFLNSKVNIDNQCHYMYSMYNNSNCQSDNSNYFALLIIPAVLNGFCYVLVFMTALEFICAQAPLRMKGMLIGVWYASLALRYLIVDIPERYIVNSTVWYIFQGGKTFLITVSFVFYCCVSKRYRYRLRDEVVNEQYLIEEVYERELGMAEEYERQVNAQWRAIGVASINERQPLFSQIHSTSYNQ